jgi:hypothetical protein
MSSCSILAGGARCPCSSLASSPSSSAELAPVPVPLLPARTALPRFTGLRRCAERPSLLSGPRGLRAAPCAAPVSMSAAEVATIARPEGFKVSIPQTKGASAPPCCEGTCADACAFAAPLKWTLNHKVLMRASLCR